MARPSSKETSRRLLAMIQFLNTQHTKVPLEKLAEIFNISLEQAQRDVEILSLCGIDDTERFDLITSGDVALVLNHLPVLQKPLRLSYTESLALEDAFDLAGISEDSSLRKKVLEAKGSTELKPENIRTMISQSQIGINAQFLEDLSRAISGNYLVELYYESLEESQRAKSSSLPKARVIEPYQLINFEGMWYLEAFSIDADDLRVYRLDRVAGLKVCDTHFEERELELREAPVNLDNAPLALVKVHDEEVLDELQIPGLTKFTKDSELYAHIPYISETWLPQQVLASLGALELINPQRLRDKCGELAQLKLTQSF